MSDSDIYLDRDIEVTETPGGQLKHVKIPDCKAWVDGDYWFFRGRDNQGEVIIPRSKVGIIRSGDQINK